MKNVLITGVGRGIGHALAEKFLAEKYFVIGTSTDGACDIEDPNLKVFALDITKSADIQNLKAAIVENGWEVNILINNAGVLLDDEMRELNIDLLRKTLDVNVIGTAELTETILPHIASGGHIVNISSQAGSLQDVEVFTHSHAPLRYPAYKISKAALNMYTRTLALRLKNEGKDTIVSSIHPGWVKTDMGGDEAPLTPEAAAESIYTLATSRPPTGEFWFNGEKYPW